MRKWQWWAWTWPGVAAQLAGRLWFWLYDLDLHINTWTQTTCVFLLKILEDLDITVHILKWKIETWKNCNRPMSFLYFNGFNLLLINFLLVVISLSGYLTFVTSNFIFWRKSRKTGQILYVPVSIQSVRNSLSTMTVPLFVQ